jgi:hypothetical protein
VDIQTVISEPTGGEFGALFFWVYVRAVRGFACGPMSASDFARFFFVFGVVDVWHGAFVGVFILLVFWVVIVLVFFIF